jgi:hypothetical protein
MMPAGPSEDAFATAPIVGGATLASGSCVGRFVVRHTIGAGGMGVVVAAYDPVLDREIALKLLRTGDAPAGDARLLREAQMMARLAHPNVVVVHEAGAADGRVYLAMELVPGGTLRAWLAGAPRTWREICDRFVEAGRGLAAAHDAGLVHRDFKPDNVLIGRDGRAQVTDFGLVRAAPVAPEHGGGETTAITGTPRYMAPEQHAGRPADPRADQFAFCVALYEALWGVDPFAAPDPAARQARVLAGDVAPPPPGKLPARLAAAVRRGLAVDPAGRYPTMRALLDDLVRDPGRWSRPRTLRLVAGLAVAALATALVIAAIGRRDHTGATPAEVTAGADASLPQPAARPAGRPGLPEDPRLPEGLIDAPDPRRFLLGLGIAWASRSSALPRAAWPAFDAASLDQIVRAGATSTNLPLDWSRLEPIPGTRDWSAADAAVAALEQRGLEPFASTGTSPDWIGRDPASACPGAFRNPPPETAAGKAAFRDFFRSLSSRYCGRVKYYEFWSEPNGCRWMSCGCGDQTPRQQRLYARWLQEWYQAMRDGCSDVVLAVGGLDCRWGDDRDQGSARCGAFVDQLYADGAGDSFDAVALHSDGPREDLAPGDDKLLNWEALRSVSAALQRHDNPDRQLWITAWSVATPDDALQARRVGAVLDRLRAFGNVFAARYVAVTEVPGVAAHAGLTTAVGPRSDAALAPRPAWFAFRDRALGPGTAWHGPANPGMEFQGQPPSPQFTSPLPSWGPDGAWALHDRFPRAGNAVLGRKFGYYSAGATEQFGQTLSDTFAARRRYCFRSAAQGGYNKTGVLPYQIGYLDTAGQVVVLATRTAAVEADWRETAGVCHDVAPGSPAIGRPIAIRFGGSRDGGASDVWFDNLRVTSVPLAIVGARSVREP